MTKLFAIDEVDDLRAAIWAADERKLRQVLLGVVSEMYCEGIDTEWDSDTLPCIALVFEQELGVDLK